MTIAERRAAGITTSAPSMTGTATLAPSGATTTPQWLVNARDPNKTNLFAISSLSMGIFGGCVLAIIFGHIAKAQISRTGQRGAGMATAGLILGYVWASAFLIYFIWLFVLINLMRSSH